MIEIPLKHHSESLKIYISTENYDKFLNFVKEFKLKGEYRYSINESIKIIYKETITEIKVEILIYYLELGWSHVFRTEKKNIIDINTNLTKELYDEIICSVDKNDFDYDLNILINDLIKDIILELKID